ncbi:hypothetical protein HCN44_004946 [Aphidius gifuensis]|uniref:Mitochondrial thiamine pyrophosphate carrier n=1 Tax=Aphidius gifuensis TaxID=684658 RepID=A0A834XW15_APHGI|nr:mitochondrial thiamine pyrophosphate carrier-like [Aphidius gifuensis]KAF7992602.1 hypothetical protein HCN44_004946 [Aphidius gifuensis]
MLGNNIKQEAGVDVALAGAASGFMTRFICQPLDVIKIRFQLQVEPISHRHSGKYRSFFHAAVTMFHEEGVSSLWKGHVPAQLLSISYGTIQFYTYNKLMEYSKNENLPNDWQHVRQFIAGAAAGSLATVMSFPFDTVRTRLVAQSSNSKIYTSHLSAYITMLKNESTKSLFRGLSPTLIQIAPHTGLQFFLYNLLTNICESFHNENDDNTKKILISMIAGSLSGLLSKTAIYPFDLARKRLQIQGFENGRIGFGKFFTCHSLIDCLIKTFKDEGITGLFKGLLPSQIKAASSTALHFTFYEQALLLLKHIRL